MKNGTATVAAPERALPGAWTALVLLVVINLFNYIDRYNLAAVLPRVGESLLPPDHPNPKFLLGLLSAAFMVSYLATAPIFGWLADRMSRWLLVGIGILVWSLATGASGLAGIYLVMFLTRCFVGIGEAAYGPAAPTIISDLYPKRIRGTVIALFYMAIPVGSALGYMLGGHMADSQWLLELGVIAPERWRWAFLVVVPPGILLAILCFLRREPPRGQADETGVQTRKPTWQDYRLILRTRSYVLNTLGMTAMAFSVGGVAIWMPTYVQQFRLKGAASLETVNFIFGLITVIAGLTATLAGGVLGDWLRPRIRGAYFVVSGVAMFIGFFLFLLVLWVPFPGEGEAGVLTPFGGAWIFVALAIFCLFFNTGPTNTILCNVVHPSMRSTGFALNILIIHGLGDAFSPAIIGYVADHSNLNVGFLLVSGIILVSAVFWLLGARHLERDTERAASLGPRTNDRHAGHCPWPDDC